MISVLIDVSKIIMKMAVGLIYVSKNILKMTVGFKSK